MSLLVIARPSQQHDQLRMLQGSLSKMEATAFFYVAILQSKGSESNGSKPTGSQSNGSKPTSWYQVLSLKTGSVVNELRFSGNSTRIIESFDMKGLLIRSASLTWTPYLIIDDCNEFGLECKKN